MFKRPFAKRSFARTISLEKLESRYAPATIVVSSPTDNPSDANYANSLRYAIAHTNAGDEIDFDASLDGQTITLQQGVLDIDHALTIHGSTTGTITIDANFSSGVFNVDASASCSSSGIVNIDHLTMTHGVSTNGGGGVLIRQGQVTIDASVITGNTATSQGDGGGIYVKYAAGKFVLSNSTVSNNNAYDDGGGICIYNRDSTITACTISGNHSGVVANLHASLSPSYHNGGGLDVWQEDNGSTLSITATTISGNTTTGSGGGIYFQGNRYSVEGLLVVNSTISGNASNGQGGGLYLGMSAGEELHAASQSTYAFRIRNSTIAFNEADVATQGGGIFVAEGSLLLESTISAGNTAVVASGLTAGGVHSAGTDTFGDDLSKNGGSITTDHCLIQSPGVGFTASQTDITGQDPLLGPLQDNGGPTLTHALASNSPAIDKGSNPAELDFDQRGTGFPRVAGGGPDIGAVEYDSASVVNVTLTKTDTGSNYTPGSTIVYTFHLQNNGALDATGLDLKDTLPAHVTFVDTADNNGWTLGNDGNYHYSLAKVAAGGSQDVSITLKLDSHVPDGFSSITNTGDVTMNETQADTSTLHATDQDNVSAFKQLQIVSVTDNYEGKEMPHGASVFFTVTYINTGNMDADNVSIGALLSQYLSFSGGTNHTSTNVGTVAGDSTSHTVNFSSFSDSSIPSSVGFVNLTANIAQQQANSQSVIAQGDLQTEVTDPVDVYQGIYAVTPGVTLPGKHPAATVRVFDVHTGLEMLPITAYPNPSRDSIRVTIADFDNDGYDDVMVSTEHGKGPIKVFSYHSNVSSSAQALFATAPALTPHEITTPFTGLPLTGFSRGGFIAVGNIVHNFPEIRGEEIADNGQIDLALGASLGGGSVKIFDGNEVNDPVTFYPFGRNYRGGVRVAIADVDGDGFDDLVTVMGNFGNRVKVYFGEKSVNLDGEGAPAEFTVGSTHYRGGLNVTAGDIDGAQDGRAEIVVGNNRLGAPTVNIFHYNGEDFDKIATFDAFDHHYLRGVRVGLADVNKDGILDVLTGTGFQGGSKFAAYDVSSFYDVKRIQTQAVITSEAEPIGTPISEGPVFTGAGLAAGLWTAGTTAIPSLLLD